MEQDQYEARLKELFDSFDPTGSGSLGQEELTDLCHMLQLEEVAPSLQRALLQDNPLGRVHFDQFKEALIDALSNTLSNKENIPEADGSPEAQPKYIKDGKRYGRRSMPELQDSLEEFEEETVINTEDEGMRSSPVGSRNCDELWQNEGEEEYEAEGQLRFWNPDDLNASQAGSPEQDWVEEKLQLICEDLGITRDGHLNRKKLITICEQYGFQSLGKEALEDALQNLDHEDTMSLQDFFYEVCKNSKPLTLSSSTPYRQLKRHLSLQPYDETGRRTLTPSTMAGTTGFRVFSKLDDGTGYGSVEDIIDLWNEEGLENSQAILKALDFNVEGKINLAELTMTLENELLITKNEIYQAALISFRLEIRHLLERSDQAAREKEKLRSDLERNEKFKSLMASEVDDHHAAIERRNEHNLQKLAEEYKERTAALKGELRKEREQILQQANRQRLELEQELDKLKLEENYLRDRLTLSMKENGRMEKELLETAEKLADCESLTAKLQRSLDNILREKFGDLDPSCVEFFLHEEKLMQVRNEYERQRRELQDRIDELQLELEEYRTQGLRGFRSSLKNSLFDEMDNRNAIEYDPGIGSEDCPPLNMSIEAELAIEQMREQHQREVEQLTVELENKTAQSEVKMKEVRCLFEKEQEAIRQKLNDEILKAEEEVKLFKVRHLELEAEVQRLKEEQEQTVSEHHHQVNKMESEFKQQKLCLLEQEAALQWQLEEARRSYHREKEELVQRAENVEKEAERKVVELVTAYEERKTQLEQSLKEQIAQFQERSAVEKQELRNQLQEQQEHELQEQRCQNAHLKDENVDLVTQLNTLKEEGEACNQKIADLLDTCEEMWVNLETAQNEKLALEKMVDILTHQVSESKARNEQLVSENEELFFKNTKNQEDLQDLNRRLMVFLKQKERNGTARSLEEWQKEKAQMSGEIESFRSKLSKSSEEISDLKNEISLLINQNDKLTKEKETLEEELNNCVAKSAKVVHLESKIASLKQEQKTWEQQSLALKSQVSLSQEKVQNLEENLQSVNLQMSRIKSDLRVAHQEKESLKQEVMSLHKQLQNANNKKQVLEMAIRSSGLQNQQKKQYWDDLEQLMEQEQQLLRQENERLQREVLNTKTDLAQCREKVRQLESSVIALKHQKQLSQTSMVKALEQEKSSLRRECDQLQKDLTSANRKISALERDSEIVKAENEGLRAKQGKHDHNTEMLHSHTSAPYSHAQLQQPACATVPREQFLSLQQVDRRNQQLQDSHGTENATPQNDHEQLLKKMEVRMLEVEQKLRIVKMFLQEKVNQLKEQVARNTRADAKIMDLYVENSQLLKALEMSEQRHQTAEKKNYLLEEKICGLTRIVRDLAPADTSTALSPRGSCR